MSRRGARAFLGTAGETLDIREVIPELPSPSRFRAVAFFKYAAGLLRENIALTSSLRKLGVPSRLVVEEPRYPLLAHFRGIGRAQVVLLWVHNAVGHTSARTSVDRIRERLGQMMTSRVDGVMVHGDNQKRQVEQVTDAPVRAVPLPGKSVLDEDSNVDDTVEQTFVCMGEIRPNKGIELAIAAAGMGNVRLEIIGKPIDAAYLEMLHALASEVPSVTIRAEFVSGATFSACITSALAVLMPYTHFEAQSYVGAKAMATGVPIIYSDLPSLREQMDGYGAGFQFENGRADDLLVRMQQVADLPRTAREVGQSDNSRWDGIALSTINFF